MAGSWSLILMLKKGEKIKIKPREWFFKHEIDDEVRVKGMGRIFTRDMIIFCNRKAKITSARVRPIGSEEYTIDLDKGRYGWQEFMFDRLNLQLELDFGDKNGQASIL